MCIGTPMQITAIDGIAAQATDGQQSQLIDLSLTPDAQVGDWLLTFLGASREIISAGEAQKITAALHALKAIMQGHTPGDAFADIEETGPQLPPHLQAALAAGQTTG